jgi:hypothetical protein
LETQRRLTLLLLVALTAISCGDTEPEAGLNAPKEGLTASPTLQGPARAGSGTARDDDCIHLTRGETAEIVVLDNMFAPECPVVVSDQILRLRNLGVRTHTLKPLGTASTSLGCPRP